MKIVADESVDRQIADRLRGAGFDVFCIAESDPGIPDEVVLDYARRHDALLLTADKDFGELVFRQHLLHGGGIMLLRLAGLPPSVKAETVSMALARFGPELRGKFCVLSERAFRIRRQY